MSERWKVGVALLVVYVIWGSTYFAIKVAIETLPPFLMAGVRFIAAGVVLLALQKARGDAWPTRAQWVNGVKIGGLLLFVGNGGVVFAQQWVASGLTAVLIATVS